MTSKLHQPITEEPGESASNNRNSLGHSNHQYPPPTGSSQFREMPMPYSGEQMPRAYADNPDPLLSSTIQQQRAWNGQQQTGMREPMLPDGDDMYSPAPPIGPSTAGTLGRHSQTVECPWCHALVSTRIQRKIGAKAGGAAVLVALIAWPLFWVPLLVPGLQRKTHYCPSCNRRIGRGRRNV
ncbi:hypothetical protein GGI20_004005 [Coemansia sp. BCRC 34301]|nr:hypothetical protein GGI20_004005 [Coemansia sp. BCRC 34301]